MEKFQNEIHGEESTRIPIFDSFDIEILLNVKI